MYGHAAIIFLLLGGIAGDFAVEFGSPTISRSVKRAAKFDMEGQYKEKTSPSGRYKYFERIGNPKVWIFNDGRSNWCVCSSCVFNSRGTEQSFDAFRRSRAYNTRNIHVFGRGGKTPPDARSWYVRVGRARQELSAEHMRVRAVGVCKAEITFKEPWADTIQSSKRPPIDVTIDMYADSEVPVSTCQKTFVPNVNGRRFTETLTYPCPPTPRDVRYIKVTCPNCTMVPLAKPPLPYAMILIDVLVFEAGSTHKTFVYDMPFTHTNEVLIPEHSYFQGVDSGVTWADNLEQDYKDSLNYDWTDNMPGIDPAGKKNFYYSKMRNGPLFKNELWWTSRRAYQFAASFKRAAGNARSIATSNMRNDATCSAYSMRDLLMTPAVQDKKVCEECADDSDDVFVFRSINGYRPKGVKLLTELHSHLKFPSNYAASQIKLDLAEKRLFIVDASAAGQINCARCKYAPILILKLNRQDKLVPVSIQLSRKPDAFVFTPADGYEWKLAQRIFEGTNSMEQTLINHLLNCHLALEVVAYSAYKTLPYNHPVYKLIYPHIKQLLTIDFLARNKADGKTGVTLIGEGGFVTMASPLAYEDIYSLFDLFLNEWTPDEWNVERHIQNHGLDKDTLRVPYTFRDDGMKYWNLMKNYVTQVLDNEFVETVDEVYQFDPYLIKFYNEIKFGMQELPKAGAWFDAHTGREGVITLVTSVMWQASAGHAIENYPIWEYGANHHIAPWKLSKAVPSTRPTGISKSEYESYLPNCAPFGSQILLMFALTDHMDDTETINNFSHLFVERKNIQLAEEFMQNITNLEAEFKLAHAKFPIPYEYTYPNNVKARVDI